jgi:exopolysaccharide biosynthesis polyprenyl glycosylphosphotransferase
MIENTKHFKRIILVLGDLLVFQIALFVTITIRFGGFSQHEWERVALPFFLVSFMWLVVFFITGLYDLEVHQDSMRLLRTFVEGMIVNLGVALAFFYLIPIFGVGPRTILFLQFAVALLLGYFWRIAFSKWILTRFSPGKLLYIGRAEDIPGVDELLRSSTLGHELGYAMPVSGEAFHHGEVEWIYRMDDLRSLLAENKASAIVLGTKIEDREDLRQALYDSLFTPMVILDRAEIEEAATGRIPLSHVSETWFLKHLRESEKTWYEMTKRGADVALAVPFGLITLALIPVIALIMKLTMPGPIFYSQTRVGKGGKPFRIWKFRTMVVDSEKEGAQFTTNAKTDPRLTRFGGIMRRFRLDELPQIWNVLRGELSFIGPRPERPEFVAPLIERMPHYGLRHITKPGLTGWAQVKFLTPTASLDDNLKKLQYDLFYIKHRSPVLDVVILLRTVGIVLRRQGT